MIAYPQINPVIVEFGPLAIRWYGVMYLVGFVASYFLVQYQVMKKKLPVRTADIEDLYVHLILGLLIGARIGYVIFYDLGEYLHNPLEIAALWHGGMSFHGGLIGALLGGLVLSRKKKLDFWVMSDLVIVTAPIGLGLGRIGNFINGELYGRITDVPWGMVFPAGGPFPRHPSQIYEMLLEGVALFIIVWMLKEKPLNAGVVTAVFVMIYGFFRFIVEFYREPDPQLGFIFGPLTMGQILSAITICVGAMLFLYKNRRNVLREH